MTGFSRHWGQGAEQALLLHCSMAHSGAWDGVAHALSDRLHLVAPDLVGHGRGPAWDRAQDFHDQTTEAACGHLPKAPCHLIGHSFGATVALRLALEHPDRVTSLTLIEPVLFAAAQGQPGWRAHEAAMAPFPGLIDAGRFEDATRLFLSLWGGTVPFDTMPDAARRALIAQIWVVTASAPALHQDRAGLLPGLSRIGCRVLLIDGANSPPVIAEIQAALAAAMPRTRRCIIPGAGHMAPITHPHAVAAEMRRALV